MLLCKGQVAAISQQRHVAANRKPVCLLGPTRGVQRLNVSTRAYYSQEVISQLAAASLQAARQPAQQPPVQEQEQQQEEVYDQEGYEEMYVEGDAEYVEGQEGEAASQAVLQEQAPEDDLVTQEVTTEVEEIVKPVTIQSIAEDTSAWVRETNLGKAAALTGVAFLAGTFALAVQRYIKKYQAPSNVRKRQVARNKAVVAELSKLLPSQRAKLSSGFVQVLRLRTGFSPIEMFRKYMWYVLRERKFDQEAVDDLVALKHAAGMKDDDVAAALNERAQRMYKEYGTLMMNTEGMTEAGVLRKATCTALFRKMLYLTEHDPLVKQDSPAAESVDLKKVFGATTEDVDRLRIVNLYEDDVDLERALMVSMDDEDDTQTDKPRRSVTPPASPPPTTPPPETQA